MKTPKDPVRHAILLEVELALQREIITALKGFKQHHEDTSPHKGVYEEGVQKRVNDIDGLQMAVYLVQRIAR